MSIQTEIIELFPANEENKQHPLLSRVYFHGVLENYVRAENNGEFSNAPDLILSPTSKKNLVGGIYAANLNLVKRVEPCLLFLWEADKVLIGLAVSIQDLRSIQYAFECFTTKHAIV